MPQIPRRALRRGRRAILWENTVIGTAEIRYFVQGLRERRYDSNDFPSLPAAQHYFDGIEPD